MDNIEIKVKRAARVFIAVYLGYVAVWLALVAGVIYVAWHFISKWW